jgi:hypothetical protein
VSLVAIVAVATIVAAAILAIFVVVSVVLTDEMFRAESGVSRKKPGICLG